MVHDTYGLTNVVTYYRRWGRWDGIIFCDEIFSFFLFFLSFFLSFLFFFFFLLIKDTSYT